MAAAALLSAYSTGYAQSWDNSTGSFLSTTSRVGIGSFTSSNPPGTSFHLKGADYLSSTVFLERTSTSSNFWGPLLYLRASTTSNSVYASRMLGGLLFQGSYMPAGTTGTETVYNSALIRAVTGVAWSSTSTPSSLEFYTNPVGKLGVGDTPQMTIESDGTIMAAGNLTVGSAATPQAPKFYVTNQDISDYGLSIITAERTLRIDGNDINCSGDLYLNDYSKKNVIISGNLKVGTNRFGVAAGGLNTGGRCPGKHSYYGLNARYDATDNLWHSGGDGAKGGVAVMLNDLDGNFYIANGTVLGSSYDNNTCSDDDMMGKINLKLNTAGTLFVTAVEVTTQGWPDYVFKPDYKLKSLSEVETYVKENSHLPGVLSAAEVEKGLDLAKMNAALLEKIEELYLHSIEQEKKIEAIKAELSKLKK